MTLSHRAPESTQPAPSRQHHHPELPTQYHSPSSPAPPLSLAPPPLKPLPSSNFRLSLCLLPHLSFLWSQLQWLNQALSPLASITLGFLSLEPPIFSTPSKLA